MSLSALACADCPSPVHPRRGSIVLLTAILLVVLLAIVAFAVDIGVVNLARTQLQRSADAAALAAAAELLDEDRLRGVRDLTAELASARQQAIQYAGLNPVTNVAPQLDANETNHPDGDIVFGRLDNPSDLSEPLAFLEPERYNTVLVRVRRTRVHGGAVSLFFAQMLGYTEVDVQAEAAATLDDRVTGFRVTEHSGNAGLLPFAVEVNGWNAVQAGIGLDVWTYNAADNTVTPGPDGIAELMLFPESGSGNGNSNGNGNGNGNGGGGGVVAGNFGTVDIGSPSNSTAVLEGQILNGITAEDLTWHGGSLEIHPATGHLTLNGDTGISAAIKDEVSAILGQPRSVPLYSQVSGQGNTAMFTIVGFAGMRVVDVDLTGALGSKHITIQPAFVIDDAAVTGTGPQSSSFVYQPVHLTR